MIADVALHKLATDTFVNKNERGQFVEILEIIFSDRLTDGMKAGTEGQKSGQ